MIIQLENIFRNDGEVLPVSHTMDLSGEKVNEGYPFVSSVEVKGEIRNQTGIVSISAKASFTYESPCDRCAGIVKREMVIPVEHLLVSQLNDENNDEYLVVKDMKLDLDELVTEDIFLNLPSKFLCKDDCKGLCSICGQNLNEGSCSCKKPIDPRLEVLRQLLDN